MKVEVTTTVDVTAQADVTLEDITAVLAERLEDVQAKATIDRDGKPAQYALKYYVNGIWQCLSAISDEMIANITPEHRAIVYDHFHKQAERWK